jgi:hypothetical protein
MAAISYTKGIYTATASMRPVHQGKFQGIVSLSRDDGESGGQPESTDYEVEATSASEAEALEEAKALAHRILGELEL